LELKIHPLALPEDARFEDRREFIIDPAVEQIRGNSKMQRRHCRTIEDFGATQKRDQSATLKG